jgi:DNA polymerase-3 subunit epsilon
MAAPPAQIGNWPRLVQLAWVLTDESGKELAAQSFIIRPDRFVIPADAVRVHGISTEMALHRGVDVRMALDALAADLPRAELLVAHNVEFDNGVVGAEFYRAGWRANPLDALRKYCTMRETTELCQIPGGPYRWKWPTLDQLHYTLFRERLLVLHEGLADARACARCFFALLRWAAQPEDSADGDDQVQELFDDIYGYAQECAGFDCTFVDDVYDQFEESGTISEAQLAALEKIRDMLASRAE